LQWTTAGRREVEERSGQKGCRCCSPMPARRSWNRRRSSLGPRRTPAQRGQRRPEHRQSAGGTEAQLSRLPDAPGHPRGLPQLLDPL
jgi:hypothetical protein